MHHSIHLFKYLLTLQYELVALLGTGTADITTRRGLIRDLAVDLISILRRTVVHITAKILLFYSHPIQSPFLSVL